MIIEEIRNYLKEMGLPSQDNYDLPTSNKTFPDGAHFRVEALPMKIKDYETVFSLCDKYDFVVNKITDITGIMFDSDEVLLKKLGMARQRGVEVMMAPGGGERAHDISQQFALNKIAHGKIRGMDQVTYAIRHMLRAVELGCRGFLMYDEGLLWIACEMREEGRLPSNTKFKVSANISIANAAGIKFWFNLLKPGDSINPIRDLTLPMIASMREVTDNPLDLHIFWGDSIVRVMDSPEIVRVGSPVYLKNAMRASEEDRLLMSMRSVEEIKKYYHEAKQSKTGLKDSCIPEKPRVK